MTTGIEWTDEAVLWDSVTGTAFGRTFQELETGESAEEASQMWLLWLEEDKGIDIDPRSMPVAEVCALQDEWFDLISTGDPGGDGEKLGETTQSPGLPGLLGPGRLRLRGQ